MAKGKKYKPVIEEFDAVQGGKLISYYRYLIPQNGYRKKRYEQKTHTVFTKEDMLLAETYTSALFSVDKEEKDNRFISGLQIEISEADSSNQAAMQFQNLPKLFAIPTKEVVVSLQKDGSIHQVLNHRQIIDLWGDIYRFLSSELTDEQFLKEIKDAGDQEFGEIAHSLNSIPLYYLFFLPLFNKEYVWDKKDSFIYKVASNLLPKDKIRMKMQEKSIRFEKNHLYITLEGRPDDDQIPRKITAQFHSLMNATSTFRRFDTIEYELDVESGFPLLIKMHTTEEVTGLFCYEQMVIIERIDEDIPKDVPDDPVPDINEKKINSPDYKQSDRVHSWILDDDDSFVI